MDRNTPAQTDLFTPLLTWIEERAGDPHGERLTLERIAARAGLSPHHFSRLFTARTGQSVMAYVRARRLVRAARRLVDEPDARLVDLAFDCGFESQEAFTRAFKRLFGVSPGRFRFRLSSDLDEGASCMNTSSVLSAPVSRLPGLVTLDDFDVAGPTRRFDNASKSGIPELWPSLLRALPFEGQKPSRATYGVMRSVDRDEGSFDYMAGVAVEPQGELPAGFERLRIPAANYAVFRIVLDGSAIHPQVKSAMAIIWGRLIPESGLRLADQPDFELYDGRLELDQPGATIDFHVPVET
ncbi:MAG: AraC family transcriptional regulator [Gammaproteobacteria bacterium]|nr:AraC family transcriptional regulator [Gammaproteobacteria bacterium]